MYCVCNGPHVLHTRVCIMRLIDADSLPVGRFARAVRLDDVQLPKRSISWCRCLGVVAGMLWSQNFFGKILGRWGIVFLFAVSIDVAKACSIEIHRGAPTRKLQHSWFLHAFMCHYHRGTLVRRQPPANFSVAQCFCVWHRCVHKFMLVPSTLKSWEAEMLNLGFTTQLPST